MTLIIAIRESRILYPYTRCGNIGSPEGEKTHGVFLLNDLHGDDILCRAIILKLSGYQEGVLRF